MAFNIFSTLNQNLQNFWGDAYDAYQAWKSKVGNVASTINNNLQDFWGDIYDVGSTIKKNVSNFWTQTYNQGKNVASTIKKNVWDYATGQINEIKAIPSQIEKWIDTAKQGVRDANYNMWNSGLKSITGKNNSTLTEAFPNAYNELSKNTGEADEDKVMKFVEEIAKAGYDQDQAMEILQTTLAEQPDFFNKKTPFDRVRQTAANRGREFWKTYEDFSSGKIGFGEATLRNAGDIIATPFWVMGDGAMSIPWVETAVGKVGETITSIPGVKPWMEAYGEFAKNNPRFAENAEAITNLWLSALGTTQGQALMKQWTKAVGRKVAQGADYIDNVTSPITTPISNAVSKWGEKIKSILAPINPDEQILKDAWLKTVKWMVWDQIVEVPEYWIMDKARSFVAPAETKRLVNRALSPRWTGLWDKQKLASVVNAEKNVRNYHQLVRSGKLKGDLSSLESTAQSVVDNLDEVGSKIGKAVDNVNANVAISDDAYKAIDDAVWARWASRTPTAKILENFKEDTAGSMTLKEAFDIKKIYQTEIGKLIRSSDAGTPQYSALVKWVDELTNQIDNAIETQLKWSKFKELKSQYRLMKSMVGDITNSAMVEWRRSPQTFVEQLGTIEAMGNILSSPIATGRQFLAKEIGEMNTRGGSWRELVKRLDNEAVSAYKKSQKTAWKVIKREIENLPVATKPPIVSKAKPKATTESAFKNNKGFISPSEIKKSLIPKKWADEAKQFYDDLVYAGNSPIVAQRETAKRFGTIRAMSASKAGTMDISKAPDSLVQEARKYKSADEFIKAQGEPVYHGTYATKTNDIQKVKEIIEKIYQKNGWKYEQNDINIIWNDAKYILENKNKIKVNDEELIKSLQDELSTKIKKPSIDFAWKSSKDVNDNILWIYVTPDMDFAKRFTYDVDVNPYNWKRTTISPRPWYVIDMYYKWNTLDLTKQSSNYIDVIAEVTGKNKEYISWNLKTKEWTKVIQKLLSSKRDVLKEKWFNAVKNYAWDDTAKKYKEELAILDDNSIRTKDELKQIYEQANKK